MSPPGYVATPEPPVEQHQRGEGTDLSTKSGQERHLVHELGVTYPQAKALIRAYILDCRDEARRLDALRDLREACEYAQATLRANPVDRGTRAYYDRLRAAYSDALTGDVA